MAAMRLSSVLPLVVTLAVLAHAPACAPSSAASGDQDLEAEAAGKKSRVAKDGGATGAAASTPADLCDAAPARPALGKFTTYPGDCFLSYQLGAAEHALLTGDYDSSRIRKELAALVRDEFDFVLFVFDQPEGSHKSAIGYYVADQTCSSTDCPKFLGTLHLTHAIYEFIDFDGASTSLTLGPSLHELAHHWANNGALPNAEDPAHWGYASVGGQLGGWDPATLQDLGNGRYFACAPDTPVVEGWHAKCKNRDAETTFGTFVNGNNAVPFGPLELWSMGLIDDSEVAPIKVATNAAYEGKTAETFTGTFTATGFQTVTIADIRRNLEAAHAPIPDPVRARTNFRMATVVLTKDARINERLATKLNAELVEFARDGEMRMPKGFHNFHTATGGRAHLRVGGLTTFAR